MRFRPSRYDSCMASEKPLLSVRSLSRSFDLRGSRQRRGEEAIVRAVDDVSFEMNAGDSLGVVGESGSGKSTMARLILRLIEPDSGEIRIDGTDIASLPARKLRALRRSMQIIFQDPAGSLNRRQRVGEIIAEPMRVHRMLRGRRLRERISELLEICGLPADAARRYPHAFSGGQKQRIAIARAIALQPRLLICDEPTSALDVSVQAQILNLLRDLQQKFDMALLFISHDMAVVEHMCDRIMVMRHGRIVEQGPRRSLIDHPQQIYTQQLLAAVPRL